jgi:hypothetical protein
MAIAEQMSRAMAVAEHTEEGAAYFCFRMDDPALKENAVDLLHLVRCKAASNGSYWQGVMYPSDFINMQRNVAKLAFASANIASLTQGHLRMDYALSDNAELRRGWSTGVALDAKANDALDKVFNAWLSEHYLRSEGGRIVKTDAKGNILMSGGQAEGADMNDFRSLIDDEKKGFKAYIQGFGLELTINALPFPTQPVQPEPAAAAVTVVAAPAEAPAAEVAPTPETTPGAGSGKM